MKISDNLQHKKITKKDKGGESVSDSVIHKLLTAWKIIWQKRRKN